MTFHKFFISDYFIHAFLSAGLLLLILLCLLSRTRARSLFIRIPAAIICLAVLAWVVSHFVTLYQQKFSTDDYVINSILHNIAVSSQKSPGGKVVGWEGCSTLTWRCVKNHLGTTSLTGGGGIVILENGDLLAVENDGTFHLAPSLQRQATEISGNPAHALEFKQLGFKLPVNLEEVPEDLKKVKIRSRSRFRITDVHITTPEPRGDKIEIYVGHHFYHRNKRCIVLRISTTTVNKTALSSLKSVNWRILYETSPCMFLDVDAFQGHESGGKFADYDHHSLLFSVGYHGIKEDAKYLRAAYGKILKIDKTTGKASVFSSGHRNPQGLYKSEDGSIWEAEHGPRGGDELNLIVEGKDYGWPHVSYGTTYEGKILSPGGAHDGYQKPVFSWLPSVGISDVIRIEQNLFPHWKGDLLVASLGGGTLFRVRTENGRAVYSEPIHIGDRIRDIEEAPDGKIYLWTDRKSRRIITLQSFTYQKTGVLAADGAKLISRCVGCHNIRRSEPHRIGPNLHKIAGKNIAGQPDYAYSEALKARSGEIWTREKLEAFLEAPNQFAPGTSMPDVVLDDKYQRKAVISYLESMAK